MQTSQGTMLQSLRAVQAFLDTNAEPLAAVVKTGTRQQLDDAIAALSAHASGQTGSNLAAQGHTLNHRALRQALLRDHMAPISRIARADLPATPALEPLKMPRGKPTAARLAAAAEGMAEAAAPFTSVFVAAGLPLDFVAQLNAASAAMLGSLTDRTQNRGARGTATQGLRQKLSAGRRIVHVLDAFVKSALQDNQPLLAGWNVVKRVPKTTGRPPITVVPPVTPPSTPTAPAPITLTPAPAAAASAHLAT
jgi:hypothetical protein